MSIRFVWIGWNTEETAKGNTSDKIWGYFCKSNYEGHQSWFKFWSARGKAMTFQKISKEQARTDSVKKAKRGYVPITEEKLRNLWPTYDEDFNSKLVIDTLADKIR